MVLRSLASLRLLVAEFSRLMRAFLILALTLRALLHVIGVAPL
jgi:hypothetical protein